MRDMQDAKCHMPQDMPPTGRLSQVPTWASQLFHELAVEHENKRIFAILVRGGTRSANGWYASANGYHGWCVRCRRQVVRHAR